MYALKELLNRSGPGGALNAEHGLQVAEPVTPSTPQIPFPPHRASGCNHHLQALVGCVNRQADLVC